MVISFLPSLPLSLPLSLHSSLARRGLINELRIPVTIAPGLALSKKLLSEAFCGLSIFRCQPEIFLLLRRVEQWHIENGGS